MMANSIPAQRWSPPAYPQNTWTAQQNGPGYIAAPPPSQSQPQLAYMQPSSAPPVPSALPHQHGQHPLLHQQQNQLGPPIMTLPHQQQNPPVGQQPPQLPPPSGPHQHPPQLPPPSGPHQHPPQLPPPSGPHQHPPQLPPPSGPHQHPPQLPPPSGPHQHPPQLPPPSGPHQHPPQLPPPSGPHQHPPQMPPSTAPPLPHMVGQPPPSGPTGMTVPHQQQNHMVGQQPPSGPHQQHPPQLQPPSTAPPLPHQHGQHFPPAPHQNGPTGYPSQAMPPQSAPAGPAFGSMPPMGGGPFPPTGYPPSVGAPGYPPGYGLPPGAPSQPAKRLDASMMPSAVQVMEDDRKARSGLFQTGYPRAELPPLASTPFFAEDQGNCNPKFVRASTYTVPVNQDMVKQCSVPIALAVSPMAELSQQERPLPVADLGQLGPVRCHRCKAYMCPFMEFNDGGRRFRCPFCKAGSDVPTEYFAHLDHTGRRVDIYERAELCLGSYELVAPKEYCKNGIPPKEPAFIFLIDVSYNSVRNGIVKLICENIKDLLKTLPKDAGDETSGIKVGFGTYDQAVHFYNLKSAVGQPAMLIVNDVQDMFVPLVDGFLVNPSEAEAAIDCLLQQIPNTFGDTKVTEVILGPVVQAGMDALKASDRTGKLFIFHSSLPLFEAPGKLKNRDDRKLLGTDKEKTILTPASEFYSKLGAECVAAGCSVDVFLFPNSYADVATIGDLCGLTGGQLFKYQFFQCDIDGDRFLSDLKRDLERPIAFDAIMRVRTSTGIRPTDFFGTFYMTNTTDVELACMDCDKTVTVELKHDDKLEEDGVFVQAALLYTTAGGRRRLRIHNLSLAVAQDLAALYRSADLLTTVNYLAKLGERGVLQKSPREVRESLTKTCAQILAAYRQHCSPSSSMGQLVLPEGLKLLPLFVNCIIKHDAFVGGSEITVDDRAWLMQSLPAMSVLDTVYYFYPRLLPVTGGDGEDELPTQLRCSCENLASNSVYLLENGVLIFLWIGASVPEEWVRDAFGVANFGQINADRHEIPEKDNPTSRHLRKLISKVKEERSRSMKLFLIKQQDKLEPWFKRYLVEDRANAGADSTPSYVDFLVHVHNEIREMLSR